MDKGFTFILFSEVKVKFSSFLKELLALSSDRSFELHSPILTSGKVFMVNSMSKGYSMSSESSESTSSGGSSPRLSSSATRSGAPRSLPQVRSGPLTNVIPVGIEMVKSTIRLAASEVAAVPPTAEDSVDNVSVGSRGADPAFGMICPVDHELVVGAGVPTQNLLDHRSCINAVRVKTFERYFSVGFELFNLSDKCSYMDTYEVESIVVSVEQLEGGLRFLLD